MTNKKLFIFPTEKQVEYINSKGLQYDVFVVTNNNVNNQEIIAINERKVKELGENVDVLCCHEESLYWANTFGNRNWKYQFSTIMLSMLAKDNFKNFLSKNNIRNAQYCKDITEISRFPIVAKPIIGFGSIGVKRIENEEALRQQLSENEKNEMLTRVKPYKEKYFKTVDNFFIYEEYIPGEFYRTPFVVYNKEIKYVFPVRGKGTTYRTNSDFHWTDFEYGEQERVVALQIRKVLSDLIDVFGLEKGVYVAEFIVSEEDKIYLLELSPRQTSERIAKLIQIACGVNMEQIAIDIFLGKVNFIPPEERSVRMQIQRTDTILQIENYKLIEYQEEQSVHGDRIITVYSERI